MKIQVHDIPADGLRLNLDEASETLEQVVSQMDEVGGAPSLDFEFRFERDEVTVKVSGRMKGAVELRCSRCLNEFLFPLEEDFKFYLLRALGNEGVAEADEIDLADEALDYGFLEGNAIDVPCLVQEQLLLAFPSKPLCSDTCKGICQNCGADLNHIACGCVDDEVDPRFEALKRLKLS